MNNIRNTILLMHKYVPIGIFFESSAIILLLLSLFLIIICEIAIINSVDIIDNITASSFVPIVI